MEVHWPPTLLLGRSFGRIFAAGAADILPGGTAAPGPAMTAEALAAGIAAAEQAWIRGEAAMRLQTIDRPVSYCAPGDDGIWPCEPVRDAIDEPRSQEIAIGMLSGIRNARGATWRGEGGTQEHELAEQYRS